MNIEKLFNKLLSEELLAVFQYKMLSHWLKFNRYAKLCKLINDVIKQEEEHIEELTERALQLNLNISYTLYQDAEKAYTQIVSNITPTQLINTLTKLEDDAIVSYKNALDEDCILDDPTTKQLFKHILEEEYEHDSSFEAELKKLNQLGENDWLTTLVESRVSARGFNIPEHKLGKQMSAIAKAMFKRRQSW